MKTSETRVVGRNNSKTMNEGQRKTNVDGGHEENGEDKFLKMARKII